MKHSKAWFIVLAGVAIFAGAASAQVRCKVPAATVVQQPTGKADKGEGLMMTSFFQTKQAKQCVGLTNLQGQPGLVVLHGREPVHDARSAGRHRIVDQQ